MIVLVLCLVALLSAVPGVHAAPETAPETAPDTAHTRSPSKTQLEYIAAEPQWLQLLHYYPNTTNPWRYTSHVDDERFFLAADGKSNPLSELRTSLRALLRSDNAAGPLHMPVDQSTTDTNEAPRCRFVERERWLRARLSLPAIPVPSYCRDYHAWRERLSVDTITLIFPAAYLNSPSSMFGHSLLRFDTHDTETDSEWLSWSLNFAAEVGNDSEVGFGYVFKGIFGGYAGRFSLSPYFRKIQTYGAIENRDIWEYRLNLDHQEIDRLVRHVWELRDIRFDYFFFRQNCSFRLLELLDHARPGLNLTERFKLTAIPADTVKAVAEAGLVSDVRYRPATGTVLKQHLSRLDPSQREWVDRIAREPAYSESNTFLALPLAQRRQIVAAANQLLIFRSRRRAITEEMKKHRFRMLQTLAGYPAGDTLEVPPPISPDRGHDTRRLSIATGRENAKDYIAFGFRWSYHDLFDAIDGYPRGAEIALGDVSIRRLANDRASIDAFRIVSLRSLSLQDPLLGTVAWEVEVGLERVPWLADNRLSAAFAGAVGRSAALAPALGVYALLGTSLHAYNRVAERLYVNAHARVGTIASNRLGTLGIEARLDAYQRVTARWAVEATQNIVLRQQQALRVTAGVIHSDDADDSRFELAYRWYF